MKYSKSKLINAVSNTIVKAFAGVEVELSADFTLYYDKKDAILCHNHITCWRISGSDAVFGCTCPVPPEILALISLFLAHSGLKLGK